MTFDPEGKQLIVANEDSDDIRMFDVNQNTGELIYSGQYVETESPVCIIFNY
jgi:6-phosphogluconolactonase (cycloisomerase 2 family)